MSTLDLAIRLLRGTIGLDPESIGRGAIDWAVRDRMLARGSVSESGYAQCLLTEPAEQQALVERVVVPETWFFRDPAAFRLIEDIAQKRWLKQKPAPAVRLLSLPCSSGEEPYGLAMTLLRLGLPAESVHVDAVDISRQALARARNARYGQHSFRGSNPRQHARFLTEVDAGCYAVSDGVRARVRFIEGNLLKPDAWAIPGNYDIVLCRNVLIYLDEASRITAIDTIQRLLKPSGLVFVGHAEVGPMVVRGFARFGDPGAFAFSRRDESRHSAAAVGRLTPPPSSLRSRSIARAPSTTDPGRASEPLRENQEPKEPRPQDADPGRCSEMENRLQLVTQLADRGTYPEALGLCGELVRAQPQDPRGHFWSAVVLQAMGRVSEAEACLRRALYLEPAHYEALVHLAGVVESRGERHAAALLLQKAQRVRQRESNE